MMPTRRVIYVLIIAALTALIVAVYIATEQTRALSVRVPEDAAAAVPNGAEQYRKSVLRWQTMFLTRDVQTAYALFLEEGGKKDMVHAHTLSHVVGAALYDRYGLSGLQYCTDDFNYGCYHGLAGRAIEEQGPAGIAQLMTACGDRNPTNCRHGVGHGIMAYTGDDRLNDALSYCAEERPGSCVSGVFMEYFVNSMRQSDGRGILWFDPQNPAEPCSAVAHEQYMDACHYGLPALWRASVATSTPDISRQFAFVGHSCEQIRNKAYRRSCFMGAGALAAPSSFFDDQAAQSLCAAMPEDGRTACRDEAVAVVRIRKNRPGI